MEAQDLMKKAAATVGSASLLGEDQSKELDRWLADRSVEGPRFLVSAPMVLPRHLEMRRAGVAASVRSDAWEGYPASLHRLLAGIYERGIGDGHGERRLRVGRPDAAVLDAKRASARARGNLGGVADPVEVECDVAAVASALDQHVRSATLRARPPQVRVSSTTSFPDSCPAGVVWWKHHACARPHGRPFPGNRGTPCRHRACGRRHCRA